MARKSKAVKSQGTRFFIQQLGAAGAAKTITAISKDKPCVVTAAGHGYQTGDVVTLSGIVGMVELNSLQVPVKVISETTFSLVGVDSTGFTAWTSGGTTTAATFIESEQHKSYSFEDPGAAEQDESTLVSEEKEFGIGLADPGTFSCDMHYVEDDVAQIEIEDARTDGEARWFRIKKRNGYWKLFVGYVKSLGDTGGVDGRNTGALSIRITGKKLSVN